LPGLANKPDFIRRFESEAHLIARLEHPYIVPLYDYWRDPDGAYLVMRWLRGGSLHEMLKKQGAFSVEETVTMMEQITQALHTAHRSQVIHRDIKPANILLDDDGNAYLADFGIAKDHALTQGVTEADAVVGSPDYLSPEQARSEAVTPQTDIYSLGVVLYEMLAGEHPFPKLSPIEQLFKHLNTPLPDISALDESVRDGINLVIQKATAKNPQERYKDVLEFTQALRSAARVGTGEITTSIVELLTPREQEVLQLMINGKSNREIADALVVEVATIKWYNKQIYRKLNVRSRVQAIVKARELELVLGKQNGATVTTGHLPEPENPYKGLRAFQAADAQDFFGREKLTQKLLSRLQEDVQFKRFLAIVGPSGSGKSSVVRAGLIPALWRGELKGSDKWYIVDMLPGDRPLDELEVALLRIAGDHALNIRDQLERDNHGLIRAANLILPDDGSELLLVIDQFEEVFTLVENETDRQHFLNLLLEAVTKERSRVRVVVTLRADYYDRPLQYPDFGELMRSRVETVLPLGASELERAVREPALMEGVQFEDGLVSRIVADVNYQPGALPLLQYALTELFERRKGRTLTQAAYLELGGTGGALAKRADELYLERDEAEREQIRQLFLRLVTLGEGAEDTRRRALRSELLAIAAEVDGMDDIIDTYVTSRLLSLDHDPATRTPTVEVAHEAILREWDRLRAWLNESREDIRQERIVAQAADAWKANKRDASYLLSGTRLEQVEKWSKSTELALTPLERDFIAASITERTSHQQAETERQAREIRLERRSRNFLRGLVAVFALATLIAGGLMIFAFNREAEAQESADYASSIALAAAGSNAQSLKNPDQAIALAVAANTIGENPPAYAQSILYDLAFKPATRRLLDLDFWNISMASNQRTTDPLSISVTPDGKTLAALLPEQAGIAVIDLNTGERLSEWTHPVFTERDVCGPNISSDGTTLYLDTIDRSYITGEIIAFDLMTGQELRRFATPPTPQVPDCGFGFSTDGQSLINTTSTLQNGSWHFASVFTWDIATGEITHNFQPDTAGLENAVELEYSRFSLSRNAQKLLIAYDTGQVVMWDVTTGERVGYGDARTRITAQSRLFPLYTPHGILVGVEDNGTSYSTTITLWDESSGALLNELTLESPFSGWQLSLDGQTLQIGLLSFQSFLLDLETWQTVELNGNQGNAGDAVFLPNGQLLSNNGEGEDARLWNVENGAELQRFEGMTGFLSGMAISPDRQTLAAQQYLEGGEAPLTLWDLETGDMLRTLTNNEASFRNVTFSPDGRFIFSASNHNVYEWAPCDNASAELRLMDAKTGELIWEVQKQGGTSRNHAVFTPDGRRILTTDWRCDNFVTVWDAATGAKLTMWGGHQAPVWTVSASPDGRWIASGDEDGIAILRDGETGEIIRTLSHPALVTLVAFSPDSQILLTTDEHSIIRLWDVASGQEIRQLTGHNGFVVFVDFSPDGRYLVSSSGGDGNIFVWDLTIGEIIRRINQPLISPIGSVVAFSPDGQSLLYSDEYHVINQVDLMLDEAELLQWVMENRYVRDLTCQERQLYRVEPLCESE
jgi:serine/threonine protein kinase/WD40 repeat protein